MMCLGMMVPSVSRRRDVKNLPSHRYDTCSDQSIGKKWLKIKAQVIHNHLGPKIVYQIVQPRNTFEAGSHGSDCKHSARGKIMNDFEHRCPFVTGAAPITHRTIERSFRA